MIPQSSTTKKKKKDALLRSRREEKRARGLVQDNTEAERTRDWFRFTVTINGTHTGARVRPTRTRFYA